MVDHGNGGPREWRAGTVNVSITILVTLTVDYCAVDMEM